MLKKTALACFAMVVAGTASAAMYSPAPEPTCTPGSATVPCEEKKWDVGFQALYLHASYDADVGYFGVNNSGPNVNPFLFPFTGPVNDYVDYKSDWGWGYKIDGSYHFNTGNDVTVDWTHIDRDTRDPFLLNNNGPFWGELKYTFDQANVVLAQHTDFGMHHNMRFYGGAQVAQIRNDQYRSFNQLDPVLGAFPSVYHTDVLSKFVGVGATTGADYSYDFGNGLSLTASGRGALLYGSSKTNYRVTNTFASGLVLNSAYASKKALVPEVEAKVGFNYAFHAAQGVMNVMAGWQVMNYFNALQSFTYPVSVQRVPAGPAAGLPLAATGVTGIAETDFALQGPYFGLKWVGNA